MRADWDRLFQAALVQPRAGAELDAVRKTIAGNFRLAGGCTTCPLNLSVIGQAYDQQEVDTLYNAAGTVPMQGPATSRFVLPAGGLARLQQPYFDIASAGWEETDWRKHAGERGIAGARRAPRAGV